MNNCIKVFFFRCKIVVAGETKLSNLSVFKKKINCLKMCMNIISKSKVFSRNVISCAQEIKIIRFLFWKIYWLFIRMHTHIITMPQKIVLNFHFNSRKFTFCLFSGFLVNILEKCRVKNYFLKHKILCKQCCIEKTFWVGFILCILLSVFTRYRNEKGDNFVLWKE